jgi:hypothetical protein
MLSIVYYWLYREFCEGAHMCVHFLKYLFHIKILIILFRIKNNSQLIIYVLICFIIFKNHDILFIIILIKFLFPCKFDRLVEKEESVDTVAINNECIRIIYILNCKRTICFHYCRIHNYNNWLFSYKKLFYHIFYVL